MLCKKLYMLCKIRQHMNCNVFFRCLLEHRADCRSPLALLLSRWNQSPDAIRSRNPFKSTLAHDAVAAVVSHKHHSIICVGAGLIQSVYGSHSKRGIDGGHFIKNSIFATFSRALPNPFGSVKKLVILVGCHGSERGFREVSPMAGDEELCCGTKNPTFKVKHCDFSSFQFVIKFGICPKRPSRIRSA